MVDDLTVGRPVRAFIVFVSDDELVAQDWASNLSLSFPSDGGPLNGKTISVGGSIPALAFKEFQANRLPGESDNKFRARVMPGLVDILFNSSVRKSPAPGQ